MRFPSTCGNFVCITGTLSLTPSGMHFRNPYVFPFLSDRWSSFWNGIHKSLVASRSPTGGPSKSRRQADGGLAPRSCPVSAFRRFPAHPSASVAMASRRGMYPRVRRAVWDFADVSYDEGKRLLSCKASVCAYKNHDNITRAEAHLRSCVLAQAELPGMLSRLAASTSAGRSGGDASSGAQTLAPLTPHESPSWQQQCAQLMFEGCLPFSVFDSEPWRRFFSSISGGRFFWPGRPTSGGRSFA